MLDVYHSEGPNQTLYKAIYPASLGLLCFLMPVSLIT